MEYDTAHGPPGLKQFTPHLRQVIWPKNFKLEKLQKYDGKENPELWVMLYETACRSAMADEHVMSNYFLVAVGVDAKVDLQTQRANTRIDIQSVPVDLTC